MFRVIVADPPWTFSDKLKMEDVKRGAESHYRTLGIDDICALKVADWAQPDALLALWVPSSLLEDGMRVMKSWGFVQKQIYTWVKMTRTNKVAFGMGRQFRGATEHALVGTRGKPKPVSKAERNIDMSLALAHSAKPEHLQERLEKMYPEGPWLEIFARRGRPGWTCVGNQSPDYAGIDIRDWAPEVKPFAGAVPVAAVEETPIQ